MDHILNNSSNFHLQSAIVKYGLSHFAFVILEYCLSSDLLKRSPEQHYVDILFSLPAAVYLPNLRYNFARVAEAPFKGLTHTPESKAQMSDSKSGANNPMAPGGNLDIPPGFGKYGITPTNAFQSGANNPIFGKYGITPTHAMTIYVYSIDNVLVQTFSSPRPSCLC
jgi:group I intron endonuclease